MKMFLCQVRFMKKSYLQDMECLLLETSDLYIPRFILLSPVSCFVWRNVHVILITMEGWERFKSLALLNTYFFITSRKLFTFSRLNTFILWLIIFEIHDVLWLLLPAIIITKTERDKYIYVFLSTNWHLHLSPCRECTRYPNKLF